MNHLNLYTYFSNFHAQIRTAFSKALDPQHWQGWKTIGCLPATDADFLWQLNLKTDLCLSKEIKI